MWRPALVTGCPGRARDGVIERMEEESAEDGSHQED